MRVEVIMRFWRRLLYRDANRNGLGTPKRSSAPASTCPDPGRDVQVKFPIDPEDFFIEGPAEDNGRRRLSMVAAGE
jgi:hypothetical protein